jgi:hypothetical protein
MQLSHTRSAVAARRAARPTCVRVHAVARPSNTASKQQSSSVPLPLLAGAGVAAPFLLQVQNALAVDGAFGILEGRTAALIHPIVMGSLFLATGYAGYLGWQWRRTRTIGEDIKALKAQLPKVAVAAGEAAAPAPPSPLDSQIAALEKVRTAAGGHHGHTHHSSSIPAATHLCNTLQPLTVQQYVLVMPSSRGRGKERGMAVVSGRLQGSSLWGVRAGLQSRG